MEEKREERKNLQLKFELESITLKSPEATVSSNEIKKSRLMCLIENGFWMIT
jgi:thiamine pyrophosphokinase